MNKNMNMNLSGIVLLLCLFFPAISHGADPQVKIRIGQYKDSLEFTLPEGGAWFAGNSKGKLAANKKYRIIGQLKSPATKKYHLMVGSGPANNLQQISEIETRFAGYKTHRFYVGNAPEKGFPDNRAIFIGTGIFSTEKEAREQQDRLAADNISSWVFVENLKPAKGSLKIMLGKKALVDSEAELQILSQKHIVLHRLEHARGYSWHGFEDRKFAGRIFIRWGCEDQIDCIEQTGLENLIVGIVPSEISSKAPSAALQAQATAARGEMLSKRGVRHLNEGFDFCSEQHCQVYKGLQPVDKYISDNISCTKGLILQNSTGGILDAVYGANCGGHSAANHQIWTSNPDIHLQGVSDCADGNKPDLTNEKTAIRFIIEPPACWCSEPGVEGADKFRWEKTIGFKEWQKVEAAAAVGEIKDITDMVREVSGRIVSIKIIGTNGEKTVLKELPIRKLFGGLRSSFFTARWIRNKQGFIKEAEFRGAGWGHGVGMCQTGAQSMAKAGRDFSSILLHYFPGASIKKLY
jgi:SpoIID/LytB domain protein